MAFSIIYDKSENRHPFSGLFHSDDPFKDLRGSNKINPQDKWKVFNIDVGEVETSPITSSFSGAAGNKYIDNEKGTRSISIGFDIRINGLYDSQMFEEIAEQVFTSDQPFMFYRDLRPEGQRHKDVAPNAIGYNVMKTSFETEMVSRNKLRVSVELETVGLPYGISYGSTKDIIDNGNKLTWSQGIFGWQNYLKFDDATHEYKKDMKKGTVVKIYNPSLQKVRHYEACLHVKLSKFTNISDGLGYLRLRNDTNGTDFRLELTPSAGTVIEQKDNIIYRNGINEMSKSNWNFIELEKGWNDIIITGADAQAEFIFKFYN